MSETITFDNIHLSEVIQGGSQAAMAASAIELPCTAVPTLKSSNS
jgi:hypothetical protein